MKGFCINCIDSKDTQKTSRQRELETKTVKRANLMSYDKQEIIKQKSTKQNLVKKNKKNKKRVKVEKEKQNVVEIRVEMCNFPRTEPCQIFWFMKVCLQIKWAIISS